jgi:flagellar L-ring protein precursor FlgH
MKARFRFVCEVFVVGGALAVSPVFADSLWTKEADRSMCADHIAHAVGDILTIVVQESSTASKDNSTKTSKTSDLDAALETFLYSPEGSGMLTHGGQMPAMKYASAQDFNGGGTIQNKEEIVTKVTVRVVDVLPNKNLVVEGVRHTSFGGESQDVVLRGIVRPEDISANNNVFSYNVSDATVKFINKGTVSDSQRKGWFTRLWEALTPF